MPIFGTFDHFLEFLGAVVPVCSLLSSLVNSNIRAKQGMGDAISKSLLRTGSILNAASINLDKVVQIGRIAREQFGKKVSEAEPEVQVQEISESDEVDDSASFEELVTFEDFKALQEKVWDLEVQILEMKAPAKKATSKKKR